MPTDVKLENYLSDLERALRPLPVSDRAEIVTEIKSHVLSALEREPNQPMDDVLAALGSAETVANRYLLERGARPVKPPLSPIIKWLVFGFVATVAMCLLFVGMLIWKFSPLVKLDEGSGQVTILNGAIHLEKGKRQELSGDRELAEGKRVQVDFENGRVEVRTAKEMKFTWRCRTSSTSSKTESSATAEGLLLDLRGLDDLRCELSVPRRTQLRLAGGNGKIDLERPKFGIEVNLSNGKVDLVPDEGEKYRYALSVGNGKIDEFSSSDAPDALSVKVQLGNGKISHSE